jgi:hypothetical protein
LIVDASKKFQAPLTSSIHAMQNFTGRIDDMHNTLGVKKTHTHKTKQNNKIKKTVVIICGGTRDIAKNEAKVVLRILSEFAKHTINANVIVMCVPHGFDLQLSGCVNKEVELFHRKLQKAV